MGPRARQSETGDSSRSRAALRVAVRGMVLVVICQFL